MAINFDSTNKYIVITSDVTSVTIQQLLNAIRDYEESEMGILFGKLANAYGKQDLGAGTKVGVTLELINDWRIKFADRSPPTYIACTVYGGNLVAINAYDNNPIQPSAYTQITIAQASSATISEVEMDDIKGTGFVKDTDSLKQISDKAKKLRNELNIS